MESFEKKTVLKCLLYFKKEENCLTQLFILLPEFEKNAEQLKPILWDYSKEIESLLSEFETIESWAFILCRLILFEKQIVGN